MKLTIKDIARMAGVSPGTVSKVINGTGSISPKTSKRVKQIIEETGYKPSFSARTLATKRSNLIGLIYAGTITAGHDHPFFNQVVTAFKNTIGNLGYDILVFSNNKFSMEQDYLARCKHFQLDGCLIVAGDKVEQAIYDLDKSDVPCVGIDIELTGPRSSYVTTDNTKVSSLAVEYLYLQSIRDISFIGGPDHSAVSDIRKKSFLHSMKLFGMHIKPEWIQQGNYFEESGYAAMMKILKQQPFPKAVFAASDMMALGAMKALKEVGLSIPGDMKVIGCDDVEASRYSDPPIATVKQDKEKMGKFAAYMLYDLINETSSPPSPVLVDPELIVRESVK